MALEPQISIKSTSNCSAVNVYEETGVYVTGVHETGWGTANVDSSNISTAVVTIYDDAGTTLLKTITLKDDPVTVNVFGLTPDAPYNTAFLAFADLAWDLPDGIYKVVYTVVDIFDVSYVTTSYQLFTCNLCACKDNLITKLIDACSVQAVKTLKDQVDQMEIFLYGIECGFACGDFDTVDNILAAATTYCQTITDCGNCGCGGNC